MTDQEISIPVTNTILPYRLKKDPKIKIYKYDSKEAKAAEEYIGIRRSGDIVVLFTKDFEAAITVKQLKKLLDE